MQASDILCEGYLRSDGSKGIRNKVLIIYTVECAKHVCTKISDHFQALGHEVETVGNMGCPENEVIIRRLLRYATHPNVGATLVVGHGCEYTRPDVISNFAGENGRLTEWFRQQDVGGTRKSIDKGIEIVNGMLAELKKTRRTPFRAEDLILGVECGGSDFTSGLAGNALVGNLVDRLMDANGTALFEEIGEAAGLRSYLMSRAVNEEVANDIALVYDKTIAFCKKYGQFCISPGNFAGGLTTVEEKSLGAVAKTGSAPIQGVVKIGQKPPRKGLWIVDNISDYRVEPYIFHGGDATSMMDLVASNAHLICLVSGRGHVVGVPCATTIKITGNIHTYNKMQDDFDLYAGGVLDGSITMDNLTDKLFELIRETCQGKQTASERLGQREGLMVMNYQHPCKVIRGAFVD